MAIVSALYARDRDGRGQQIDISLLESALALEVSETSGYFATGQVPEPLGSAHRGRPYQAVRTADGHITIGATSPSLWVRFCAALGLQSIERDERFANVASRRANYLELAALIEEVTTTQPSEHWYRLLEKAGVPCGVLNRVDQVVVDEQVQARGFVVELPAARPARSEQPGPRCACPVRPCGWSGPVRCSASTPTRCWARSGWTRPKWRNWSGLGSCRRAAPPSPPFPTRPESDSR